MYKLSIYKTSELDDYEKGCLDGGQDFGCIDTANCSSMSELLDIVKTYGTPAVFDDHLIVQVTENGDGHQPMMYQIEDWKKGLRKLYAATYSFYISEVTTRSIGNEELKRDFPELEEG